MDSLLFVLALLLGAALAAPRGPAVPDWGVGPFVKLPAPAQNPVLGPNAASSFTCPVRGESVRWEEKDVFNPAAVVREGKVHLLYRAEDVVGSIAGTSRIGLAVSDDGVTFDRLPEPVLFPEPDFMQTLEWDGGIEDPRVVEAPDGTYVMMYTAYNGVARLCVATSADLRTWTKHGPVFSGRFSDSWTKAGSIVCEMTEDGRCVAVKVGSPSPQYWMYWGEYHIHVATSDDLVHWTPVLSEEFRDPSRDDGKKAPKMPAQYRRQLLSVFTPRAGKFDSELVEPGPPAMLTPDGIVFIYNSKNKWCGPHGACAYGVSDLSIAPGTYSAGQVLLDRDDPTRVLQRTNSSFLTPQEPFEVDGQINNVCFLEGLVQLDGNWLLYYGTADSKIAVARAAISSSSSPSALSDESEL